MAKEACIAAKAEGNAAYGAGDLDLAVKHYSSALAHWDEALESEVKPKTFSKGDRVVYNCKGFGRVESAFTVMDEYFLTDLGTAKPIWCGDVGGDLKRFSRSDLQPVPEDLFDLRLACSQNLAAVMVKKEDWQLAIKWSDEALRMDGWSPKALMRKGNAMLKDGQAGPASNVLVAAKEVLPNDPEVKRLLRQAEKARAPNWVCASGCCGPWGIGDHMVLPTANLNTLGKGSAALSNPLGPMKFGPTTAGTTIENGDDSDSDCSGCSDSECGKENAGDQKVKAPSTAKSVPVAASASAGASAQINESNCRAESAPLQAEEQQTAHEPEAEAMSHSKEAGRPVDSEEADSLTKGLAATNGAASKHRFAIAAASFAVLAAMVVAWQLGNFGAVATAAY